MRGHLVIRIVYIVSAKGRSRRVFEVESLYRFVTDTIPPKAHGWQEEVGRESCVRFHHTVIGLLPPYTYITINSKHTPAIHIPCAKY